MNEIIETAVVGLLLALLIVVGGLGLRAWRAQRPNALTYQRAWNWLAARTGLTFEAGQRPAGPRLAGGYRGRTLTLTLQAADGARGRTLTQLHLALRHPVAGRLTLARRGGLAALWPRGSGDDFLRHYAVRSEPMSLAQALLASPGLKRKLLAAAVQIELGPDGLRLLAPGIVEDPEYLAYLFDVLSETARLLEGAHPQAVPGEAGSAARTLVEA